MRVTHVEPGGRKPDRGDIFVGEVERQDIVAADSRDLRLTEVRFLDGARNRWHVHSTDQILVVTEGYGIVAADGEERTIGPGDVAFVPANTRHWHGARPGTTMAHYAIMAASCTTTIVD